MANTEQRGDPNASRLVVIAAAVVGAGALLGYGYVQIRERDEAKAEIEGVAAEPTETPAIAGLIERARAARAALDTPTLERLDRELAAAAKATTSAPKASEAREERLAVLGTLAVEATVRGALLGDRSASTRAAQYLDGAEELVGELEPALDPGVARATRARLALVAGDDAISRHPLVLLPAFRDRELQSVLLTAPLWHPESDVVLDDAGRAALALGLEQLADPTALERLLLVLALPSDQDQRAQSLTREVLAAAPAQPLAAGLLARLRGDTVAVAELPDPVVPDPVEPDPIEPDPVTPDPVTPDPVTPDPVEPDPKPVKPDPKPDPKPKPKPKASVADLVTEGCKLVRGGSAEQGFAMLQRAFDHNPRDTKVVLCMAEGHMKLGRLPSARAMVERVLRSSSKNKKALLLAAKIEDQLGNRRSAVDYYRKLLELEPGNGTAQAYVDKHG